MFWMNTLYHSIVNNQPALLKTLCQDCNKLAPGKDYWIGTVFCLGRPPVLDWPWLSLIMCFRTVSWPVSIKNKDGSFLFECEISFNFILFLNQILKTFAENCKKLLFKKRFAIEVKYFVDIIIEIKWPKVTIFS